MNQRLLQTSNLQRDGGLALQQRVPLVLIFSQAGCEFCERLKDEVFYPLLLSGDYDNRVIIREFMIDEEAPAIDFQGGHIEPIRVFQRYGMIVTPTVLIVDGKGRELAERLTGINTVDYYFLYLDQAINRALAKIR